jgi:hypothetical protein
MILLNNVFHFLIKSSTFRNPPLEKVEPINLSKRLSQTKPTKSTKGETVKNKIIYLAQLF